MATDHCVERNPCPVCHKGLDAATGLSDDDARPKAGDVSVCVYCGSILLFADDAGRLRLPAPSEMRDLQDDKGLWRALQQTVYSIHQLRAAQ